MKPSEKETSERPDTGAMPPEQCGCHQASKRLLLLFFLALSAGVFWGLPHVIINTDADLPHHILLGRLMLGQDALLSVEPTSFNSPGHAPILHEWLAQIAFAALFQFGGLKLLLLFFSFLIAATFTVTLQTAFRNGSDAWIAVATVLFSFCLSRIHLIGRPHLFSWMFFSIALSVLLRLEQGKISCRRALIVLAPILVLWSNLHGAFLYWFAILAAFLMASLLQKAPWKRTNCLSIAALVTLAASLLNPYGPKLLLHIVSFLLKPQLARQFVAEYRPPFVDVTWSLMFVSFCALASAAALRQGKQSAALSAVTIPLGVGSFFALRHVPFFAISASLLIAPWLSSCLRRAHGRFAKRWLESSARLSSISDFSTRISGALYGFALLGAFAFASPIAFSGKAFPVSAAAELAAGSTPGREQRIFNYYDWGGYLAFRLYPSCKVFIHGMFDHYGDEVYRSYLEIAEAAPGWQEKLFSASVEWVLVPPDGPLALALASSADWRVVYRDQVSLLAARSPRPLP